MRLKQGSSLAEFSIFSVYPAAIKCLYLFIQFLLFLIVEKVRIVLLYVFRIKTLNVSDADISFYAHILMKLS